MNNLSRGPQNSFTVLLFRRRNAYNIDCLAPYGGPIEAGVVYGGMPKPAQGANPEYTMANGLAVTFMVTNKVDKSQLVDAMEWELK